MKPASTALLCAFCLCDCLAREKPVPTLDEPLAEGQVRAGVITRASELLQGVGARGAVGDFKLYNRRVAFIVQAADTARLWGPYGGGLLDAARLAPGTATGIDRMNEVIPVVATSTLLVRALRPTSARLVADGSQGGPAVLRIEAVDDAFPIFDAGADPIQIPNVHAQAVTEYVLEPEAEVLRMRTTLANLGDVRRDIDIGDGVMLGDGAALLAPGIGQQSSDLYGHADIPLLLGAFPGEVSYAWAAVGGPLRVPLATDEVLPVYSGRFSLFPGQSATVERILAVGSGDAEDARRIALTALGQAPSAVLRGIALDPTGAPISQASITVSRAGKPLTALTTDADGRFSALLDPGSVDIVAEAPGRAAVSMSRSVPGPDLSIALGFASGIRLTVLGEGLDGSALGFVPARVRIDPGGGLFYPLPEETQIPLTPGTYHVTVSRGMEFEPALEDVTVAAGEWPALAVTLRRAIDVSGFLAADFHIHAAPSIDSELALEDRVRSCAGEGLAFAVATDHDVITDYRPTIEALGLGRFIGAAPGTETSPLYGHVNGFPLRAGGPYWTVRWWRYDAKGTYAGMIPPTEVFSGLRALGARVVQLNHARSTTSIAGIMNYVAYDPARGFASVDPAVLSRDFDAYEVMNSHRTEAYDAQVTDWYSFIRQGHRVVATGTSDSHGASAACGFPRTYVQVGDDPSLVTGDSVADALLAQRAIAAAGAFVTLRVGEHGFGEIVPAPGGDALVRVQVQGASFVGPLRLSLRVNGAEVTSRDLAAEGRVRFDEDLPVHVDADAFVSVLVTGDTPMLPVHNATPYTVTNPIYLDADGDGRFTPPGP
jgi:hypothetical protein